MIKKVEESSSSAPKSSVGRLISRDRPAISSYGRFYFDAVIAKKGTDQPSRRSARTNKDFRREASTVEDSIIEDDVKKADDRTRFPTS